MQGEVDVHVLDHRCFGRDELRQPTRGDTQGVAAELGVRGNHCACDFAQGEKLSGGECAVGHAPVYTPAGLPDTQQLLLVDKDAAGMTTTKEILPVRFSLLEDPEEG